MSKIFTFAVLFFIVSVNQVEIAQATTHTAVMNSVASTTSTTTKIHNVAEVEKRVREYFSDIPVMIEIAKCESKFRQFTDSGSVLRGGGSMGMIGIYQFYEVVHKKAALTLGFDIDTVEGNLGYARHLYTQSGSTPWVSCVPNVIPIATFMTIEKKELQIKLLQQVIVLLQELLKLELVKQ